MREIGQIVDERGAVDVFAERNGEMGAGGVPFGTFDEVPEEDFYLGGIGDFDGHGVATGDRGQDVDAFGFHRAGEIAFEIADAFHADAGSGVKFVAGDGRASGDVSGADLDIKMRKGFDNAFLVGLEFILGEGGADFLVGFLEEVDGGEFVFVVGRAGRGWNGGRGGFGGGLGFGSRFGGERRERGFGGGECFESFFRFGRFFIFLLRGFRNRRGHRIFGSIENFGSGPIQRDRNRRFRFFGGSLFFGDLTAETLLLDFDFLLFEFDPFGGIGLPDAVIEVLVHEGAAGFTEGPGEFGGTEFKEKDENNEIGKAENKNGTDLTEDGGDELVVHEIADVAAGHFSGRGRGAVESVGSGEKGIG